MDDSRVTSQIEKPPHLLGIPTALILGAGASAPYGFPLGPELKNRLLEQTANGQTQTLLQELGFDLKLLRLFSDALRYGTHPTVDVFLEKKTSFRDIGSFLIALTLIPLESPQALFPQKDWYGDLFNTLNLEGLSNTDNLSIVTLNYDRSLEHFLFNNIEYNCPDILMEQAHKNREKIHIVHAHGSLGNYPDVGYGISSSNKDAIRSAADSIKIISDHLADSDDFADAKDSIKRAERIVIIGFGYNQVTLDALLADVASDGRAIYGTAYKLDNKDRERVEDFFNGNISLGSQNQTAMETLRKWNLFSQ
ncbi:hypothetical protein BVX97_00480 [bacterium E08(2017)]|nr:hypothetical protein BVX97_00480 [bacterium E08(2017)]